MQRGAIEGRWYVKEQQVGGESWIMYALARVPMVWGKCMTQKTFVGTEAGVKLRKRGII